MQVDEAADTVRPGMRSTPPLDKRGHRHPMSSRRIGDAIDDLKQLGHAPDTARVGEIRQHLAELVDEVRRTIDEVDDARRANLIQLSRQAHSLFVDARDRAERAVNIAEAFPVVLSPMSSSGKPCGTDSTDEYPPRLAGAEVTVGVSVGDPFMNAIQASLSGRGSVGSAFEGRCQDATPNCGRPSATLALSCQLGGTAQLLLHGMPREIPGSGGKLK
ncbi:hypothetical protein [Nocardia sp. NPDC050793]|uniref:hypothetical protein n=1 Tax=Nocardia sp. NPDC050793 TaxID=3155159 RepID=UPI0033C1423B